MSENQTEWRLREAGPEDARALALIGSATFLDAFAGVLDREGIVNHCAREHSAEAYTRYLRGGARAWLAEAAQGGAPIGFAMTAEPDLPSAREGDIELKRIYALSRFHGCGLGKALLDAVLAAHAECERVILGVYAKNHRALGFYRKQGFEQVGTRRFDVGGTLHDDEVLALPMASAGAVQP